jgi:uncharacterized damage-inducible protein DinB
MALGRLASHVAELPKWITMCINTDELDFNKRGYNSNVFESREQLLQQLDENVQEALSTLEKTSDAQLQENWTLRNGEHVIFTLPKINVIRSAAMNHMIHHRGQLSVFLRLLDIPVPGMYGPSADES